MSIASIVIIAIIVILSVIAVVASEDPLDELFQVEAAINGFTFPPLATKVTSKPSDSRQIKAIIDVKSAKDALVKGDKKKGGVENRPRRMPA